jgi:Do/DeqQ family serine protease
VTNNHVIQTQANADAGITVALADNREFEAKVILKDERSDLAVLRIQKADEDFPHLKFGDSDALEVGDIVLAVGNPLGIGQTVTTGIVSALARTRVGVSDYQFFIQTDAAINPGNSGGALVDVDGRLVGINTAIYTESGGSQGIGFAIPVNMVKLVVDSALKGGRVKRPWLGADLQPLTQDLAQAAGLDRPAGAIVTGVHKGGPAAAGGLRDGDVILNVDGHNIADPRAFLYYFTTKGVAGSISADVWRGGKKVALSIRLVLPPEIPLRNEQQIRGYSPFSGAKAANLSPALAEELGMEQYAGVVIIETEANSAARRAGFLPGDIIVQVNGADIGTVDQLQAAAAERARVWRLVVRRGGSEITSLMRM